MSFKADRSHLRAWLAMFGRNLHQPLGDMPRDMIIAEDINLIITQWLTAPSPRAVRRIKVATYTRERAIDGQPMPVISTIKPHERKTPVTSGALVAIKTVRHRCRLLKEFYRTLDGPNAPTPLDDAKIPRLPKTVPIHLDVETVRTVARALASGDPKTYARFLVLNTTGQRPCQMMRAEPGDVTMKRGLWVVRSAKLEPAHTITLNTEMVAAWRTFVSADAWGVYDTTRYGREVHAAGWPKGIRPYVARHSVMADALAAGVDLDDVQGLAGHTSPVTTRNFYGPLAVPRQRTVSNKIAGRMKGVVGPRRARGPKAPVVAQAPLTSPAVTPAIVLVPAKGRRTKARVLPDGFTRQASGKTRK